MGAGGGTSKSIVSAISGDPKPRLEIRVFVQDAAKRTLLVRGLQRFQNLPPAEICSYFQVAAIHGLPYEPFDGVNPINWQPGFPSQPEAEPRKEHALFGGYCHHNTQLFPTWRRPYLMMFEKLLYDIILEVAKEYGDDPAYVTAAADFRLPYWDWAANVNLEEPDKGPPLILMTPSVLVEDPFRSDTGERVTVDVANPLFSYHFPRILKTPLLGTKEPPYKSLPPASLVTLRHPKRLLQDQYGSDNKCMADTYTEELQCHLQRETLQMLIAPNQPFRNFSNVGSQHINRSSFDEYESKLNVSLEQPHNNMHNYIGASMAVPKDLRSRYYGHMYHPPYSSYDPVFWLHHSNVDRQLALWEALNAETEMEKLVEDKHLEGTFTNKGYDFESGPDVELFPFRKVGTTSRKDEFWKSRDVMLCYTKDRQVTSKLGYYYPELEAGYEQPGDLKETIIKMYNATRSDDFADTFVFLHLPELNRRLLPASFNLRVYIKDKLASSKKRHFAGTMTMFENPFSAACKNCTHKPDYVSQQLEISAALHGAKWTKDDVYSLEFLDLQSKSGKPNFLEVELSGPGAIILLEEQQQAALETPLDLGCWGISTGPVGGELGGQLELVQPSPAFPGAAFLRRDGLFTSLKANPVAVEEPVAGA